MSDSETSFDPVQLSLQQNQAYFDKHIQAMQNGSFFAVALSISTLLDVEFTDEKIRAAFLASNCYNHLILLFDPQKYTNVDALQVKKLREDAYSLCEKICQDDFAIQQFSQRLDLTLKNIDDGLAIPQLLGFLAKILRNPQIQRDFWQKVQFLVSILKQCLQQMFTYNVVTRNYKCNRNVPDVLILTVKNTLGCYLACRSSHRYRELFRQQTVDLLTQLLYSNNQQIKYATTNILKTILTPDTFAAFIPHLAHFTTLLTPSETPEFLYSASHILVKVALLDSGDKILTQNGAIYPIIQLLSVEDEKIRKAACQVVIGISTQNGLVNVKICDTLCLNGVIAVLYEGILKESSGSSSSSRPQQALKQRSEQPGAEEYESLLSLLLNALAYMCTSRECQAVTRQAHELHENLVERLNSLNPRVIKWASQAIANMCRHSQFYKQTGGNLTTTGYFLKLDAVERLFSVIQRVVNNIYQFSHEEGISVLFSVSEALSVLLHNQAISKQVGAQLTNIFTILIHALKTTDALESRASLLGLVSQLSKTPENAQVFLEHKIVDYVAFLALEAQTTQSEALISAVSGAISNLCRNAPNYRTQENHFYGEGSVLAEFGRRGVVQVVCGFIAFDGERMPLMRVQCVKNAVFATAALSKCGRNCLLMWKESIIERLLKCVQFGDKEMKEEAAAAIRNIRKTLQAMGEASTAIGHDAPGMYK